VPMASATVVSSSDDNGRSPDSIRGHTFYSQRDFHNRGHLFSLEHLERSGPMRCSPCVAFVAHAGRREGRGHLSMIPPEILSISH